MMSLKTSFKNVNEMSLNSYFIFNFDIQLDMFIKVNIENELSFLLVFIELFFQKYIYIESMSV